MTRYQAALEMIRATDILRTLQRVGRTTKEDVHHVVYARHDFDHSRR